MKNKFYTISIVFFTLASLGILASLVKRVPPPFLWWLALESAGITICCINFLKVDTLTESSRELVAKLFMVISFMVLGTAWIVIKGY